MEASVLLQQQLRRGYTPVHLACSLKSSSSSDDSDALMIDPTLDYINGILMDEGDMDDAAYLQQANGTSNYQAIFSSLQDMIGDNSAVTSHGGVCDPCQSVYCLHQTGPDEYHAEAAVPHCGVIDALHLTTGPVPPIRGQSVAKDGVLTDATTSCWCKNGLSEGPRGHVGQEQDGNGCKSKLLHSADERVPSNLVSELELSFEELKIGDFYASLYVEEPSSSTTAARSNGRLNADKKKSMSRKGSVWEKHRSDQLGPDVFVVDVKEVLVSCAQAVAIGDVTRANAILKDIHKVYGASAHGTALQRIAYIFSKALVARMSGMGAQLFKAMSFETTSYTALLRASKVDFKVSPFRKIQHYFANQSILKVAEGASRLHIVDFGLMFGLHWACLIHALADRKGGPPLLVITGVDYPDPGFDMAERLVESGRRLAAYANTHNVPFQYHALVTDKWEDLDAASLHCSEVEVLVVNFCLRLRMVPDENVDSPSTISPRQKLLTFMHSLDPHLLVTMTLNGAHNLPFFVSRFREALFFYAGLFEMVDTLWGVVPEWLVVERAYFYASIINIVACEGVERVQRPETYKHWHACITKAGFLQLPLPEKVLARSKSHMKQHYHKDFLIQTDEKGWMLLGWKGRIVFAVSAWRPCHIHNVEQVILSE